MQLLSKDACSTWIATKGLIDSPYGSKELPFGTSYTRAVAPEPRAAARPVFHSALMGSEPSASLIVIWDWSRHSDDALPDPLQRLWDELRPGTFEGAGIEFESCEVALALESVVYTFEAGMSAYIYLAKPDAAILLWEGEFIELWTRNKATAKAARRSYEACGLQITIAW